MNNFIEYAKYYNLLNKEKNYIEECDYLQKIFKRFQVIPASLLDFGCGTGRHAIEFARRGHWVQGVDLSEEMIKLAKEAFNKEDLPAMGEILFLTLKDFLSQPIKKNDVSVSLFHVANYQTTDEDLIEYFRILNKSTKPGGLVIFDYWYRPAVDNLKPEKRKKIVENDEMRVTRISTPNYIKNGEVIEVLFDILIEDKLSGESFKINENHKMRPILIEELKQFIPKELKLVETFEWLGFSSPTNKSWSAVSVFRKS